MLNVVNIAVWGSGIPRIHAVSPIPPPIASTPTVFQHPANGGVPRGWRRRSWWLTPEASMSRRHLAAVALIVLFVGGCTSGSYGHRSGEHSTLVEALAVAEGLMWAALDVVFGAYPVTVGVVHV